MTTGPGEQPAAISYIENNPELMPGVTIADAYEMFRPAVYGQSLGQTRNPTEAEDVVQDLYERMLRSVETSERTFANASMLKAYIMRATTNIVINGVRRTTNPHWARPDAAYENHIQTMPSSEKPPEDIVMENVLSEETESALQAVQDEYRVVLVAIDLEGMTYEECSKSLNLKFGTVQSRLSRGRQQFRNAYKGSYKPRQTAA